MAAELPAIVVLSILLEIVRGISDEGEMLKLEVFGHTIQYAVYIHPYRLWIYHANFFWESTNKNANLSLGTGMGFSYCVHLIIKPNSFGW